MHSYPRRQLSAGFICSYNTAIECRAMNHFSRHFAEKLQSRSLVSDLFQTVTVPQILVALTGSRNLQWNTDLQGTYLGCWDCLDIRRSRVNQLTLQPQCGLIMKSPEIWKPELGNEGEETAVNVWQLLCLSEGCQPKNLWWNLDSPRRDSSAALFLFATQQRSDIDEVFFCTEVLNLTALYF